MELLLNLVWVGLVAIALLAFAQKRPRPAPARHTITALLALMCALVLLFPVVSASDDLHPTQAVLEDASKRIHQLTLPSQQMQGNTPDSVLPAILTACLLCSLVVLQRRQPQSQFSCVIERERLPRAGRAPPYL